MDIKNSLIEYIKKKNIKEFGFKNVDNIAIQELPKGLWSFNFVVISDNKKVVFKIYTPNREGFFINSGKKEFEVLDTISKIGIAPKPILFDDAKEILNYDILAEEYLDGEQLKDLNDENIKKVAQLLAKLHSVEIPQNSTIEKKDYRVETLFGISDFMIDSYSKKEFVDKKHLEEFKKILEKIKADLTPIPQFKEKDTIIHMDMVASNFLILKNGEIKLVDWQSPGIGDPAFDVWGFTNKAFNLWDLDIFMDERKKKTFLAEYLKFRKDENLLERIKYKKDLWILILTIHSLIQYQDFLAGKVDKNLMDRKDKFTRYKKAFERGLEELKELFL